MDRLPLTSISSLVLTHSFILSFLVAVKFHMDRRRESYSLAHRLTRLNNAAYALMSLVYLCCLTFLHNEDRCLRYIYHLSKFYESIDLLLVLLSKGPVSIHFAFHHATTPLLSLAGAIQDPTRDWLVPAWFNVFHHAIMYSMFAGLTWMRKVVKITGTIQLVVGLIWMWRGIGGLLYFCYSILWVKELIEGKRNGL